MFKIKSIKILLIKKIIITILLSFLAFIFLTSSPAGFLFVFMAIFYIGSNLYLLSKYWHDPNNVEMSKLGTITFWLIEAPCVFVPTFWLFWLITSIVGALLVSLIDVYIHFNLHDFFFTTQGLGVPFPKWFVFIPQTVVFLYLFVKILKKTRKAKI